LMSEGLLGGSVEFEWQAAFVFDTVGMSLFDPETGKRL
jgi:hypothetical protein